MRDINDLPTLPTNADLPSRNTTVAPKETTGEYVMHPKMQAKVEDYRRRHPQYETREVLGEDGTPIAMVVYGG